MLPLTRRMDHRPPGLLGIGVYGLPHLAQRGSDEKSEMPKAVGKDYQHKTTGLHQMQATDASYFRAVGWGYYMVTVVDGYSRFILPHRFHGT